MTTNNIKKTSITIIKEAYINALSQTQDKEALEGYNFVINHILPTFSPNELIGVRTAGRAYNAGDIGEVALKNILGSKNLAYSTSGENDLQGVRSEVKTFVNSKNDPNGFNEPIGFYAITKNGVYYIPKKLVELYYNTFKVRYKNGNSQRPQITRKMLYKIINKHDIKKIDYLSKAFNL